jgi:hypothetical protein
VLLGLGGCAIVPRCRAAPSLCVCACSGVAGGRAGAAGSSKFAPAVGIIISTVAFMWVAASATSSVPGIVGPSKPAAAASSAAPAAGSAPHTPATPLLAGAAGSEAEASAAKHEASVVAAHEAEERAEKAEDAAEAAAKGHAAAAKERYWVFHLIMVRWLGWPVCWGGARSPSPPRSSHPAAVLVGGCGRHGMPCGVL